MLCGQLVWDLPRLVFEMKRALNALSRAGVQVSGIGIDTWGVDFGLLDARGRLLALPVHYRDARTEGVMDEAFAIVSREELFGLTGIAFNSFNTLFQLLAMKRDRDPALDAARTLLFMPDLLAYCLTGVKGVEYTIASTSQLLDPERRDWSDAVFDRFGLPRHLTLPVDRPGAPRGTLLPQIARECGVGEIPVFAVGGHDTASAVAAVPGAEGWLCLSVVGDVVAAGRRDPAAHVHAGCARRGLYERGRRGWVDPPAQEHHGPVDHPGVQARMGPPRRGSGLRRAGRAGEARAGVQGGARRRRRQLPRAGRHARARAGLLPPDGAERARGPRRDRPA